MAYTFSGTTSDTEGGTTSTVSMNIGPVVSPFVWIVVFLGGGTLAGATLTCGGVTLHQDAVDGSGSVAIYSGTVTGKSGAVNVVLGPITGSSFALRSYALWYDSSDTITLNATSTSGAGSSFGVTISVVNTNYMFALCGSAGTSTFATSTVAPNNSNTLPSANGVAADWVITATNASFAANISPNAGAIAVAAYTETTTQPPVLLSQQTVIMM